MSKLNFALSAEDLPKNEEQAYVPKYDLPKVEVSNGEEEFDVLFALPCRLYRFKSEWKGRGTGNLKILKHKSKTLIRAVLRQEKMLNVLANFEISEDEFCNIEPKGESNRVFVFQAKDFSSTEVVVETFAVKFALPDVAEVFKKNFSAIKEWLRTPTSELSVEDPDSIDLPNRKPSVSSISS